MNTNPSSSVNIMNNNVLQAPIHHVEIRAAHATAHTQDIDVVDEDLLYPTPLPCPRPLNSANSI